MQWDIRPLDGIGLLKLGMTPDEVGLLLNATAPISSSSLEDGGFLREVRGETMPICHYKDGRLFLVDTHVFVPNVTIYGEEVYAANPLKLLQLLEKQNGGAEKYYNFVVFDQIGINTQDFYSPKEDRFFEDDGFSQDDRGIAVYQPGPDTKMDGSTPISFKRR